MATFLTDLMKKGYTQDEIFAVFFESERERKRRRMQAIVTEIVNAHRLKNMKEFFAYEKLVTWRRMNVFDRTAADDNQWASRPLPLMPEQFTQSMWSEVNALKDAISMPAENTVTRPRQKTMDVVDGRRSDSLDELLANFEFARIKEWVEKRSRKAAQVTVTLVDTYSTLAPARLIPIPRQVYMSSWRVARVRLARS